jgi:hypothetical protein
MPIRNPSDYVQERYDDMKNLVETILNDGVESVSVGEIAVGNVVSQLGWTDGGSNQNIPASTVTKIEWETAEREDTEIATADLSNNEIDIQSDGVYLVRSFATWASASGWSTGDSINHLLTLNGSNLAEYQNIKAGTGAQSESVTSWSASLSAGDKLSAAVYQNSGSGRELRSGANDASVRGSLIVHKLG